jgi:cytochrome c biogenesis protein CcmG, thiol:disulfide interchange protein DsbE
VASSSRSSVPRWVLVLAGVGVLGLAVLIAVVTAGEGGERVTVAELAGSPEISGEPLPPAPGDPAEDEAVGDPPPTVEGADFEGTPVTVGAGEEPELLVFMASWCPHCQDELVELVEWVDDGGVPDGLSFTAIVTGLDDARDNWPPDAWLEEEGWTGPTLVDDAEGSVAQTFGQPGTPYWVAIDGNGDVVLRVSGRLPIDVVDRLAADLAATG